MKTLDLRDNQISEIPAKIIQLENLERDEYGMTEGINIQGNPIINPPYEIAEKGIDAIRIYFLNQQLSRYKDDDSLKIERSIEFPPEYWTAGTSILSYFSRILSVKYPDQNIKVRIEQEGLLLRMIIDTPTGERELIEQTLNEYSMVITGKLLPKNFLSNPFEVMALENKLENMKSELRQTEKLLSVQKEMFAIANDKDRQRIDSLEMRLSQLIEKSFSKDISPVINNHLTVNANDHLSQNHTNQHGQGDNIGNDKVGNDKVARDKIRTEKINFEKDHQLDLSKQAVFTVAEVVMKDTSSRDKIFVSYSHQDKKWLEQFKKQIKPHVRVDGFEVWDDTKIKTGSEWREEIEKALASAKVAVLLVSPNFIASDFIHNKELPPLLNAAKEEGLTVFWIPISSSAYKITEIEKYQATHPPDKPLDSLKTYQRNKTWVSICEKIAEGMK